MVKTALWAGHSIWKGDFLIPHSCDFEDWHLLILLSALFLLTHQHKVSQILGTRRKGNWRELGEKEMVTTMRKPSWQQLREQCYQAHKYGANFIYGNHKNEPKSFLSCSMHKFQVKIQPRGEKPNQINTCTQLNPSQRGLQCFYSAQERNSWLFY